MEGSVDGGGVSLVAQVALQVVSILMVAFFSSSEASLISVNKFRVRHLAVIV
jgi:Mg2+/Co2+ transporter CorB